MSDSDGRVSRYHGLGDDADLWDGLVLAALGETVEPDLARHFEGCAICSEDVATLRLTIDLARAADPVPVVPADSERAVWDRIATELDLPTTRRGKHAAVLASKTTWRRHFALVAAAAVFAAGGAIGGYLYGRGPATSESFVASATLDPMSEGGASVGGDATVHETAGGSQLSVETRGLPPWSGYYEVWLYDPLGDIMVAVGTLSAKGSGTFPVPPGLDVGTYHVVDVSAQEYDGNPAHAQSVLRGSLADK